jgi:L-ascorbate metabolism protein UlaG (beta-lactamase superfamily)
MIDFRSIALSGPLADILSEPLATGVDVALHWLGQAGFALRTGSRLLLIDPYLSDSLATKYRGTEFPHVRMMPAPVAASELGGVDAVLCTHRHSDHMDSETLGPLAVGNPSCRFVVPRAHRVHAVSLGLAAANIVGLNAGDRVDLGMGISVEAVPSAHETLATNERGENLYLGYVLRIGGLTLYHSGDCVPYDGLSEKLRVLGIDVALLPVNGRSAYLSQKGIAGNFTAEEAASLCRSAGIPLLLCHHFGMFAFNTVDEGDARRALAAFDGAPRVELASVGTSVLLGKRIRG